MRSARFTVVLGLLLTPPILWPGNRALSAGMTGGAEMSRRVARLVKQLGHDQFTKREEANKELEAIGEPALGALRKAAASSDDAEIRRRAERISRTITNRLAGAEQKRLEGTWVGVASEENGKEAPARNKVVLSQGRSVATKSGGAEIFRCTWRVIDPTLVPRQLDLVGPDGRVFLAIYELDGARLRYCGSYTRRPDRFATEPGDGQYMATLEREPKR